jgi:hypothetical protein
MQPPQQQRLDFEADVSEPLTVQRPPISSLDHPTEHWSTRHDDERLAKSLATVTISKNDGEEQLQRNRRVPRPSKILELLNDDFAERTMQLDGQRRGERAKRIVAVVEEARQRLEDRLERQRRDAKLLDGIDERLERRDAHLWRFVRAREQQRLDGRLGRVGLDEQQQQLLRGALRARLRAKTHVAQRLGDRFGMMRHELPIGAIDKRVAKRHRLLERGGVLVAKKRHQLRSELRKHGSYFVRPTTSNISHFDCDIAKSTRIFYHCRQFLSRTTT